MRRTALLVPALLTSFALAAPAVAAPPAPGEDPGPPPAARAFGPDGKPAKVADVLKYCETKKSACSFKINRLLGREFATAVRSLGNSVVNCTQSDMSVERTVTLKTASTDNIGGEISGKVTAEGTVNASGSVTGSLAQEGSSVHKTPDLSKGPTTETGSKTTVTGGSTVSGSLTARLMFEAEFKATYSKSWTVENTEETVYKTTVKPHDILVFGASAAMRRVTGNLITDIGSKILGISVDSPSMVNTSSFVAQTYAAPANVCQGTRPTGNSAPNGNNTP